MSSIVNVERKDAIQPFVARDNSPFPIDALPEEVILDIFQRIKEPRDWLSLSLVNRTCRRISFDSKACRCTVPSYISQSSVPSIQQLTPLEKVLRSIRIENKLLSNEPLPIVHQVLGLESTSLGIPLPKTIIDDYLVIAPIHNSDKAGMVHIYDLKNKCQKEFELHLTQISELIGVHAEHPLLVSRAANGTFTIWNLKDLFYGEQSTTRQPSGLEYSWETGGTRSLSVHGHMLAAAFNTYILVWDCKNFSDNPIIIKFLGARQVKLTDTHLMVLGSNEELAIWTREALQEYAGLATTVYYRPVSLHALAIKNVKMHNDFAVLIFQEPNAQGELGEVVNWKENRSIRMLAGAGEAINAIDCWDRMAFVGASGLIRWNLEGESEEYSMVFPDSVIDRVYILGQHVLYTESDSINIQRVNGLSAQWKYPLMVQGSKLHSFDLDRYLIMETSTGESETCTITVYEI